ncbi:MAG TPA: hypothetical protein DCG30_04525 [Ruminococcus sp.]|nr:hypothetical protein [Ruminococcus sp.]
MKKNKIVSVFAAAALMVSAMPFAGISANAADTDATGNTKNTAIEITFDEVVTGDMSGQGYDSDSDWYLFTLKEPSNVNINCGIGGGMYSSVQIIDARNNSALYSKSASRSGVDETYYLTTGDYYINFQDLHGEAFDYDIKVTAEPCGYSFESGTANNSVTDALSVDFDTKYNAQLSQNDGIDYYTFTLPKDARITFDFVSEIGAADWALYNNQDELIKDGTYTRINENDGRISKKNSLILESGKYTVSVAKNSNSKTYGAYTFSFDYLENYSDVSANGIISFGDITKDGKVDSGDASIILCFYAYRATNGNAEGSEADLNKWVADKLGISEEF